MKNPLRWPVKRAVWNQADPGTAWRVIRLFRTHRPKLVFIGLFVVGETAASIIWPFLLRGTLDVAIPEGRPGLLAVLTLGMICAAVAANIFGVFQTVLATRAGQQVMHSLRTEVYGHVQSLPMSFFTRARAGEVQSRLVNDIGGMETTLTATATSLVSNVVSVFATLIAMLLLDWRLTIFVLVFLVIFVWITRRVGHERRDLTEQQQRQLTTMTGMIGESLSVGGVLLGRTMGRQRSLRQRFSAVSANLADIEVRVTTSGRWRMSAIGMLLASTPPLLYWIAGSMAQTGGPAPSIGEMVAFVALQQSLVWPTNALLSEAVQVQSSMAFFERVFEYLDAERAMVSRGAPVKLRRPRGEVRFEDVAFSYDGDPKRLCLADINLAVPAGSHLAIVGPTGSGKTTLGYLVARLYDVTKGRIKLDGMDVRDLDSESLAEVVGVVPQDPFFFNETILANLLFAKPDAVTEEIHVAAQAACIHDFILSLPEGYNTVLGERGYRISGGEKQRLAIARTLLRDPRVLVLDEATSALDVVTESKIQASLEKIGATHTLITIAHRLSTARNADQIVVVDGGRIVERGSHDALVAAGGRYAELIRHNSSNEEGDAWIL